MDVGSEGEKGMIGNGEEGEEERKRNGGFKGREGNGKNRVK